MREKMDEGDGVTVWFTIDEESDAETVAIELETEEDGPDLSDEDEVIVAFGGRSCDFAEQGPNKVRAELGPFGELHGKKLDLMVRVHEWFEGWELEL